MIFPQPSIHVFNIRIDEPVTAFTDIVVAAVCYFAFRMLTKNGGKSRTILYLRFYFLLMCFATLYGGIIGHAFLYALGFSWKLPGWIISMLSVALIERSAIEYCRPLMNQKTGSFFLVVNIIELITIMFITMYSLDFKWVEFHSGYGLLAIVLPFHAFSYFKTKDKGSLIIILAVLIASLAALTFMNKISLHTWFNHLDISHTLMAFAAFVFYRGALLLNRNGVAHMP